MKISELSSNVTILVFHIQEPSIPVLNIAKNEQNQV